MKKVELREMENNKYLVIKEVVDHGMSKERASVKLALSIRQINRLINVYKTKGKEGFVHGNRGRKPSKTISDELRFKILTLYKTSYEGANIKHFRDLLAERDNINISYAALYFMLRNEHYLSPNVHKQTVRKEKALIKALEENKKKLSPAQKDLIVVNNILDCFDAHARIPRLKYAGECIEMDASTDYWFGDRKMTLHGAIDNATGRIVALWFDYEETLNGYYHVLDYILRHYGIPAKFLTDNRTVFIYNGLKEKSEEKDTLTQFGYACFKLGIDLETTSIPQKKSRIERLWETLQGRLPIELRLKQITTLEEANAYLTTYMDKFNRQFALPFNYSTSVFQKIDPSTINNYLAIISHRKFDTGSSIKFQNKYYQAYDNEGHIINYKNKTECIVIKTFDEKLMCEVDDKLSVLMELPDHQKVSKEFDEPVKDKTIKLPYKPPMSHPWKEASYQWYLIHRKYNKTRV